MMMWCLLERNTAALFNHVEFSDTVPGRETPMEPFNRTPATDLRAYRERGEGHAHASEPIQRQGEEDQDGEI